MSWRTSNGEADARYERLKGRRRSGAQRTVGKRGESIITRVGCDLGAAMAQQDETEHRANWGLMRVGPKLNI